MVSDTFQAHFTDCNEMTYKQVWKTIIIKMKQDLRKENQTKKVLILGAGYVTPPVVDYLSS